MSKSIWLQYYDEQDPECRPLGRLRVFPGAGDLSLTCTSRQYKEILARIRITGSEGTPAFIGPAEWAGKMVLARRIVNGFYHNEFAGCVQRCY